MGVNNWTEDQLKAIEKRDSNILVSASAGSGKTAVLVERIIEKILNDYLDVDKILVVTFTNAAAQELKEKILNAIYKALENEKDPKKINHLKNQLIYINRASITTIDAFCFKLVRENFNILNIDPNIRICEESQSVLIKTRVLEDLLEEEYESYVDEKNVFGLYNILELFSGKDEELLDNILRIYNYIQSFPYPFKWLKEQIEKYNIAENIDLYDTDFGRDIYEDIVSEIELCIEKYDDYLNKISGIEEFNKCYTILDNDIQILKSAIAISNKSWDKLYENISNINFPKFVIGKVSDEELKNEISEFRKKEVKSVIDKIKKKIYAKSNEILEDNKIAYKYIKYLYEFLVRYDNNYREEKKNLGVAEFNDIMHYALELLVDEEDNITDIALGLKDRYKEIYTDEYQDTSYVQERILDAISKDNNRFMVGDIKQSIYGFRQARPDIFNDKYISYSSKADEESSNCKIILSKNFRSREEVIDSINYIFEKIMSMKNGQCDYTQNERLICGNTGYISSDDTSYKTQINIINLKDKEVGLFEENDDDEVQIDEDLSNIQIEAKCIAYKIKEIIKKDKVMDKDGMLRSVKYKDIVVLLRGIKNKAEIIEEELKRNNIPVFCDTSSSIFEGDEVKLVLSFLKIIDNPYQDIYMISIMFSIIGNFTLDEITKIRLYDSTSYVYDTLNSILNDEEYVKQEGKIVEKIKRFLSIIKEYTIYSKKYSISELLIRLYKDTNIYYQFALEDDAESKKANLNYLIELASTFYSNIGNTLNAYIKYIDNLKDKQDTSTTSAKIIGENEDVVRLMTIHKSKGLEFPIVILADTSKGYNFSDSRKQRVVFHHKYGIGIDVVNQDLGVTYPSLIKQAIRSVIEKETKSEELRLLYVALTRAKEKLFIFATTKDYDKEYSMQTIKLKNGKFNETLVASNTSYYKNLLPVIKYYNEFEADKKEFDIQRIEIKSNTTDEELRSLFNIKEAEEESKSINDILITAFNKEKVDKELLKSIKENLESEYRYYEDAHTPSRVSVSELKQSKIDEEDVHITSLFQDENRDNDEYKMPSCLLEKEEKYTPVRKGLLIHFILQNLEFKSLNTKSDIKNYIDKLKFENVISEQDSKYISITKIYNFLNSKIGKELKDAKKIFREYEFILKNEKISNSLIQGIIDLFYITEDNKAILVDFKTDKLDNEQDFIDRYKIQLKIYKDAINTLTDYNIYKTYIYSFNLNKEIELKEDTNDV